jgi:hypothetical protein
VSDTIGTYSATFTLPAEAFNGVQIEFSVGAQTSGQWDIAEVQLEPGPVATPFEFRQYTAELRLCQGYAQWVSCNMVFNATGAQNAEHTLNWAPMRASPSAAELTADPNTSQSAVNQVSNAVQRATPYGGALFVSSAGSGACILVGYRSLLTAEL